MVVYFDDILIYSRDHALHLQHLRQVLSLLQKEKFFVVRAKFVPDGQCIIFEIHSVP